MDRSELIEIRSEEVHDIISKSPSWLLRWGIVLMFFVFTVLLGTSWFIRYPDVIKASVIVTTRPAPVYLVPKASGKITLFKKENDVLKKGDLIAYIQTTAEPDKILSIEKYITFYQQDNNLAQLETGLVKITAAGGLQSQLNNTIKAVQLAMEFERGTLHEKQTAYIKNQLAYQKRLNANMREQFELQKQEAAITFQNFSGDSTLYAQRMIPLVEFSQSRSIVLQQQRGLKGTESAIINGELQIEMLQKQLMELEMDNIKRRNELTGNVTGSISELKASVETWKENYFFISPADGELAYVGFLENNQHIDSKPLFAILPSSGPLIALGELPIGGAGKVKAGQRVKINLNNYPKAQFGTLSGIVEGVSKIPNDETYRVIINLPDGLKTSYKHELMFQPQLQGETEIITENLRLLERFFYQFRSLILK